MQTYHVKLESPVFSTFRCQRAANALDIDVKKKSVHQLSIEADLDSPFHIGLILGASGSGKTSLAKFIAGENCFQSLLDMENPVIDQLPKNWSYDECAQTLHGIGLTSVPHWIKPAKTLSNGQRARAEAALLMAQETTGPIFIDEWTSVVDRTVAKAMSHTLQKYARKNNKKIILLSCHYDVVDWLNPDWIIDCNKSEFQDRRSLRQEERERKDKLEFTLQRVPRTTWRYFSQYHYLSEKLPGGYIETYGLFHKENQVGFQCFANYVPRKKPQDPWMMHSNRTVIHPDYAGLGLGIKIINAASMDMIKRFGNMVDIRAKFSSEPVYRAFIKSPLWKLDVVNRQIGRTSVGGNLGRAKIGRHRNKTTTGGFRENVKTWSFRFIKPILNKDKNA